MKKFLFSILILAIIAIFAFGSIAICMTDNKESFISSSGETLKVYSPNGFDQMNDIAYDSINHVCYIQLGFGNSSGWVPWLKSDGTPMIWGVDWPTN